ncbi:MAG: ABC transporter permease, partial [Bryobacteraceae bacterium]
MIVSQLRANLRYALRNLAKQPSFSFMVAGMLALGIAGTTTMFSIFNGLFLRPFPFQEPGRLVDLDEVAPRWNLEFVGIAYPDFHAWREQNRSFEGMAVWDDIGGNLTVGDVAERVNGALVTHDLLKVLGLKPQLGRGFLPEEDKPNGPKVATLSDGIWRRLFQGRSDAVGKSLRINTQSYT